MVVTNFEACWCGRGSGIGPDSTGVGSTAHTLSLHGEVSVAGRRLTWATRSAVLRSRLL
ncbi:MAG: hypothetical protein LBV78_00390 [Kitasatospora sp.]|jgi:hypothetical protein|nr:hypothetical protein [Kitasatospora sp.]